MKSRGILMKNTAALLMVLALVVLLLPCINVTTVDKTVDISGYDILAASVQTGLDYYKNGTIDDNYVIKGDLTWGDLKSGLNYANEQENIRQAETAVGISLLPILFSVLAIIFLLMAFNKITMVIPTLLTGAAFIENVVLIGNFQSFQEKIFVDLKTSGVQLDIRIGIYVFTALCGIAFLMLLAGWITTSFSKPEPDEYTEENYKDNYEDSERKGKERKDKKDKDDKKKSRRKSKSKKKKKETKEKKENKKEEKESEKTVELPKAQGKITGNSGIYDGIEFDLSTKEDKSITLGTTKENIELSNHDILKEEYFVIQYNPKSRLYDIQSYTNSNLVLHTSDGQQYLLSNGSGRTVGSNTRIYVGSTDNKINLQ